MDKSSSQDFFYLHDQNRRSEVFPFVLQREAGKSISKDGIQKGVSSCAHFKFSLNDKRLHI